MNWFAIGAGIALVVAGIGGIAQPSLKLSRPVAVTLGLVGLFFLYLGGALELFR
jgi:hypothetical protein